MVVITVYKRWEDNNDEYGLRPDSIQAQVYVCEPTEEPAEKWNWEPYGEPFTIKASENWQYKVKNLPLEKEDGTRLTYSVHETERVPGYYSSYSGLMYPANARGKKQNTMNSLRASSPIA